MDPAVKLSRSSVAQQGQRSATVEGLFKAMVSGEDPRHLGKGSISDEWYKYIPVPAIIASPPAAVLGFILPSLPSASDRLSEILHEPVDLPTEGHIRVTE